VKVGLLRLWTFYGEKSECKRLRATVVNLNQAYSAPTCLQSLFKDKKGESLIFFI